MTALPHGRGLAPAHLKTPSTVHSSRLEAVRNTDDRRTASRSQSRIRVARARQQDVGAGESTSQSSTLAFIHRVLAPERSQSSDRRDAPRPIEDTLPPLTSSNELDVQLYAVVAIVLKEFVNAWYTKITPDHEFSAEIVQIIAHCTRALEQRLRHVDLVEVLLDDLAALIDQHVKAYRYAKIHSEQYSYSSNLRTIYHNINPHPALDPVPDGVDAPQEMLQAANETVYRQLLVQGTLAVLLPIEDVQNDSLRTLVGDILADLILGQALTGKVCEGWFIHDTVIRAVAMLQGQVNEVASGKQVETNAKSRLEAFGLINKNMTEERTVTPRRRKSTFSAWFWRVLQVGYSLVLFVRFTIHGLSRARSTTRRSHIQPRQNASPTSLKSLSDPHDRDRQQRPVLSFKVYGGLATILRLRDRMPWLISTLMFLQHLLLHSFGQLASFDSSLDRFLYESLTSIVLPPTACTQILMSFRAAVFPYNALGPPAPPPPSPEEKVLLRTKAAQSIVSLIPSIVARTYFNTSDEDEIVEQVALDILDCFGDQYLNKHLVYGIIELLLVKLMPELEENGITDLLAERGVSWAAEAAVAAENDVDIDINVEVGNA